MQPRCCFVELNSKVRKSYFLSTVCFQTKIITVKVLFPDFVWELFWLLSFILFWFSGRLIANKKSWSRVARTCRELICNGSIWHFYVKLVFLVQMVQKVTEFEFFRIKTEKSLQYLRIQFLEIFQRFLGFHSEKLKFCDLLNHLDQKN